MDTFLSAQLALSAITTGALYALIATGLNLVYGTLRLLNIAHGDLVMVGAYIAYWVFTLVGFGPLVSIPLAIVGGVALGALVFLSVIPTLARNNDRPEQLERNSLLIFFGISVILQNAAALFFSNNYRAYRYFDRVISFDTVSITGNRLVTLIVAVTLAVAAASFLRFTLLGLATRAVIQSRDAAAIVGINLRRIYLVTLCFGFSLAMVSGALISMNEEISPVMGFSYSITAFVVVMLGSLGNIFGGIIAALTLGAVETYGLALIGSNYQSVLVYGIFILTMLVRPEGLFGSAEATR